MFLKVCVSFFYNAVGGMLQLPPACAARTGQENKRRVACYLVAGLLRAT